MDKKTEHTAGPWHVANVWAHDENVVYSGTLPIAHVSRTKGWGNHGERPLLAWRKNAALISAAPELLRELKHLVALLGPVLEGVNVPGLATLNGAEAAIKRAEREL